MGDYKYLTSNFCETALPIVHWDTYSAGNLSNIRYESLFTPCGMKWGYSR